MDTSIRRVKSFPVTDFTLLKAQLLAWASRYSSCAFLDNNQYHSDFHTYECLLAVGTYDAYRANAGSDALAQLQQFINKYPGEWLFGHLGYDLKSETEAVTSTKTDTIGFADVHFFVPVIVVRLGPSQLVIESVGAPPEQIRQQLTDTIITTDWVSPQVVLQPVLNRDAYLQTVRQLQQHILRGDCYEVNFCLPFTATDSLIEPVGVFNKLCGVSPMPFASFYRQQQQYLLCASPERFLQKSGNTIYAQPMKGTAPRHAEPVQDAAQLQALQGSQKERSENVMVADLVRNDLSKICREGSVQATGLFGIQTYPQVHQMVSTISGELRDGISFTDIIRATFPMGSMTGAPKKRVLELIDQYEPTRRGLFSGSVGYIDPAGNFDFNVVIRSLLYNAETQLLQYFAGSAITFYSVPEQEYEECMLKTKAVRHVLEE
jgi:para-aminobenzoate synthetase component I